MRVGGGEFLLGLAGVSATLLGTFIVGVFLTSNPACTGGWPVR